MERTANVEMHWGCGSQLERGMTRLCPIIKYEFLWMRVKAENSKYRRWRICKNLNKNEAWK
jgi:hypothetical protein